MGASVNINQHIGFNVNVSAGLTADSPDVLGLVPDAPLLPHRQLGPRTGPRTAFDKMPSARRRHFTVGVRGSGGTAGLVERLVRLGGVARGFGLDGASPIRHRDLVPENDGRIRAHGIDRALLDGLGRRCFGGCDTCFRRRVRRRKSSARYIGRGYGEWRA